MAEGGEGARRLEVGREFLNRQIIQQTVVGDNDKSKAPNSVTHASFDCLTGFGQSQTCRIQRAILTSCFMTPTIQGCASISFGVGRVVASRINLHVDQSYQWSGISYCRKVDV